MLRCFLTTPIVRTRWAVVSPTLCLLLVLTLLSSFLVPCPFVCLSAAQDEYCTPRVEKVLDQYGWAAAAARPDGGTTPRHVELERLVAEFLVSWLGG